MNWKVGDLAVIKPGGLWYHSAGQIIKITKVYKGSNPLIDFTFINEIRVYSIIAEELDIVTKLHKALL